MVLKNTKNVQMSKFYKTFPRTVFTESNLFLINHTWYNRWYTSQVLTTRQYRHLLSNGTLKPVELAEEVLEAKVRNSIHHLQLFQWIPTEPQWRAKVRDPPTLRSYSELCSQDNLLKGIGNCSGVWYKGLNFPWTISFFKQS